MLALGPKSVAHPSWERIRLNNTLKLFRVLIVDQGETMSEFLNTEMAQVMYLFVRGQSMTQSMKTSEITEAVNCNMGEENQAESDKGVEGRNKGPGDCEIMDNIEHAISDELSTSNVSDNTEEEHKLNVRIRLKRKRERSGRWSVRTRQKVLRTSQAHSNATLLVPFWILSQF